MFKFLGSYNLNKYFTQKQHIPSIELYKIVELNSTQASPTKHILLWTKFFGTSNWELSNNNSISVYGSEYFNSMMCPVNNCIITYNRSYLQHVTDYDAVLFHVTDKRELVTPVPSLRSLHQKYVMATVEPPSTFRHSFVLDDYFYNWTMTYKLISDAIWPYCSIFDKVLKKQVAPSMYPQWREKENFYDFEILNLINNKKKMAAQFISHCGAVSKRDALTKTLQKYISVDVYGKCGPLKCEYSNSACDEMLNTDYKFYLAFENDLCEDYVTEKLFNALDKMIIPIVYGGADYNRWAPPGSYIDANNFATVQKLAEYLKFLDQNPMEYMKYFWWKKYYKLLISEYHNFCDLCVKLNYPNIRNKIEIYGDIKNWFTSTCNKRPKIKFR